jgi:uncharacterized protein (TIGR00255 family)
MRSMTGYGRGVAEQGGHRAEVEIRSVNHRFMDVKLRGAPLDAQVEERVSARIRERITRGSITVAIRLEGSGSGGAVRVDREVARRIHAELVTLASELHVVPHISLDLLCAQPGVIVPIESDRGSEALAECACEAVDRALDDLVAMRDAEGESLARDLVVRMEHLGALTGELERHVALAPQEAQRRLGERLTRLLASGKVVVDEARLAQEVAILADRMDVTEELVRIKSHIGQLAELMGQRASAIGRRLDFLVQELGREYNTVASKSQSADIARLVVEAKAELEKVREQVQNIE